MEENGKQLLIRETVEARQVSRILTEVPSIKLRATKKREENFTCSLSLLSIACFMKFLKDLIVWRGKYNY